MDLEMVLNDLSLEPLAPTAQEARQRMTDLLETARIAIKFGVKRVIRTSYDLNGLLLAPNYLLMVRSFSGWLWKFSTELVIQLWRQVQEC